MLWVDVDDVVVVVVGWLALSAQGKGDGTLEVIPMLKEAISYILLRPLVKDGYARLDVSG